MKLKKILIMLSTATMVVSFNAGAKNYHHKKSHHQNKHHFVDYGRVVNSHPVYEYIRINEPEEKCWNETVIYRDHHRSRRSGSATDALVGAVVGGVIGNQFGKGNGKKAATVAGSLIGASIASDASNRHHRKHRGHHESRKKVERHCEVVDRYHERRELVGYDVDYRYKGETYSTFMRHEPGRKIKLNVNIAVAE